MRFMKILSSIIVLMIFVFGIIQLSFAQTNTDTQINEPTISNVKPLKPVAVSPTTATQISKPTPTNVQSATTATSASKCLLSDELMKEYNLLITELRKAESEGDKESAEEITKEIISLKQAITKAREECELKYPKPAVKPTPKPIAIDECKEIEQWELKYAFYKEIYSLSDEEIKKKGYSNREEIEKILSQLSDGIVKLKKECGQDEDKPVLECVARTCPDGSTTTCETKTIEKCGVNTYSVSNQCDNAGTMFRNVYVECYDGIETMEGDATSCKPSSDWQSFAKDFCEGHCKKVETLISSTCPEVTATAGGGAGQGGGCFDTDSGKDYYKKGIAAGIWDSCISKYKLSERYCTNNNEGADYIKECPLGYLCENGSCVESEEDDREELITPTKLKPIVADSGEEIKDYYKTRIEKITSLENVDEQIKGLKALRQEIDNLIENLIKGKNTITTSDVSDLVTKISVNAGEINADNVQIKTVGKKVLMSVNDKPISIEPSEKEVLIKDENLDVRAEAVSIQENVLKVGNAEVKLTASDVVDKLKIAPKSIELKEENTKAVYKIKAEENRRLFGFIPIKIENDLTANAENGDVLEEHKPWYAFLTTE